MSLFRARESFPKKLKIDITQEDIDGAECGNPRKCMIKLAVKRIIGGHGYVFVDLRGVSITRRNDYREHAVLPKIAYVKLLEFDKKLPVTPFSFWLEFKKTTKIAREQQEAMEARAPQLSLMQRLVPEPEGEAPTAVKKNKKTYTGARMRISGIALTPDEIKKIEEAA